jgi:hypothetical protein
MLVIYCNYLQYDTQNYYSSTIPIFNCYHTRSMYIVYGTIYGTNRTPYSSTIPIFNCYHTRSMYV